MASCRHPPHRLFGYNVRYSDKIGDGSFGGMNCYAALDLGYPYPYPCSTVLIDRNQGCRVIRETILHEAMEANIMKRGVPYRVAHKRTMRLERG